MLTKQCDRGSHYDCHDKENCTCKCHTSRINYRVGGDQ